ncbi:hypothetical protein CLOSCI_00714 [[Clostridium] scindens ATCC 35704]|nr:hypothetical protein CLOSCI_00714 [[Clostridium] scindens ATCC 35704]
MPDMIASKVPFVSTIYYKRNWEEKLPVLMNDWWNQRHNGMI